MDFLKFLFSKSLGKAGVDPGASGADKRAGRVGAYARARKAACR